MDVFSDYWATRVALTLEDLLQVFLLSVNYVLSLLVAQNVEVLQHVLDVLDVYRCLL